MRGIRRISMPAISATNGWITKTSSVIGGFLREVNCGRRSYRRLLVRRCTIPHYRRARRGALLPLPDVPTGAWRPGDCLADGTARRLGGDEGHPRRLSFLGKGVPPFLRQLWHAADMARRRQPPAR